MEAGSNIDGVFLPRRASEWLIALHERPGDAALQRRFEAWLAADPAHRTDWSEMSHTHAVMGGVAPLHADRWAPAATARPVPELRPDRDVRILPFHPIRRTGWRRLAIGITAAAGIAAALLLAVFPTAPWWFSADHVTTTREISTFRLADGSTVRLGPESVLDVVFSEGARDLRLLRGTAFFEVVPDSKRPFRVQAGLLQATAIGTAFEVDLDENDASVAVRHGTVAVDAKGQAAFQPRKLTAGDWVRVARNGALTSGDEPPAQVAAWLDGHLIVKDRPAGEVIDMLRRYYRGVVIVRDDRLAGQPLTGVYDLTDPVAALDAIADALGAKSSRLSPWVLVLSDDEPH
jgi:transmembrane sensor